MKLLTLNTHSLAEADYEHKLYLFADMILKEQPDVFALQEVNQTITQAETEPGHDTGYRSCRDFDGPVRADNHGLRLAGLFKDKGCPYYWTWVPAKVGYDVYEEGLALFSRSPIEDTSQFFISRSQSFSNWKTRKVLGIRTRGQWFYSVHMGWWADPEEPFMLHWDRAAEQIERRESRGEGAWIMGDFNSPSDKIGEGYDYVKSSGWFDTYDLALEKDSGITVAKEIDGWREGGLQAKGMRIDYIWCSQETEIIRSCVICNGSSYPVVSDHYGVMVITGQE
ncbi:MAG: endonuclease/exonuclease/phosphatase family protein [Hungatella sp.]|jgi:maltose 6'-phosphate phosphatase|nr:endonuclease/exonuclease/phosphatase family protein [Hungatella sp.]